MSFKQRSKLGPLGNNNPQLSIFLCQLSFKLHLHPKMGSSPKSASAGHREMVLASACHSEIHLASQATQASSGHIGRERILGQRGQ